MKTLKNALCTTLAVALAAGLSFAASASGIDSLKASADANLPSGNEQVSQNLKGADTSAPEQNWIPTGGGECAGNCGAQAPSGCWCDESCAGFGDCCAGVCDDCPELSHCAVPSCDGACGGQSPGGCWCDEKCAGFGDCCDDVCEACPDLSHCGGGPKGCVADLNGDGVVDAGDLILLVSYWGKCPVAGLPGSCAGSCGTSSPDGCWCDESCCGFGDCCQDKTATCGGCSLPPVDCPGDLNGDGRVDMLDILILLGDWGCVEVPANPCDNATGDCFSANGTPGCEDAACCGIVCAQDAFCCDVEWDSLCADAAELLCKFDPAPECPGASCGNFIPCAADPDCICVTLFNGGGICVLGSTSCAGLTLCPAGNECAPGEICAVQTCCGDNVCVPPSTFCNVNPILPSDEPKPGTKTVGHAAYPGAAN